MFRSADRVMEDAADELIVPSPAAPAPASAYLVPQSDLPVSRYGVRRTVHVPAVMLIILVHAALITALVQARQHVPRFKEVRLSVVNLSPPPPPPVAEAPPPPSRPEIVAPPPLVPVPVPPTLAVATTPDPVPVPSASPVAVPVPVAATATTVAPNIVQGGDIGTQMVAGKPPRYPIESRRKREQGTVILDLTLGIDGAVESMTVTQSSGFPRLDNAARDAVRGWRWKPMIRDGQAVRVRGIVEIPFVLRRE
ncbi:energy transducer TonB [Sphingobium sp. LB126]|nr:energy transducer TonB [Sphingobium sp. LB126]